MKSFPVISSIDQSRQFVIWVGQNSKENWDLIDSSDEFDLWFHINDKPSGHVIIKEILSKGKIVDINSKCRYFNYPSDVVLQACNLCKSQSKYKNEKVNIVYTTINNVCKGKDIGSVFVKNTKLISL
jgi:predicted ribosome quality control (RQC) complex YloA/Tae2 family protein